MKFGINLGFYSSKKVILQLCPVIDSGSGTMKSRHARDVYGCRRELNRTCTLKQVLASVFHRFQLSIINNTCCATSCTTDVYTFNLLAHMPVHCNGSKRQSLCPPCVVWVPARHVGLPTAQTLADTLAHRPPMIPHFVIVEMRNFISSPCSAPLACRVMVDDT